MDQDGNITSPIQSLYLSFGSGVLVEGMEFHLQNRGALFEMAAEHPNKRRHAYAATQHR